MSVLHDAARGGPRRCHHRLDHKLKEMSIFSGPLVSLSMESAGLPSTADGTLQRTTQSKRTAINSRASFERSHKVGTGRTSIQAKPSISLRLNIRISTQRRKRIMLKYLVQLFDGYSLREGWGTFRSERTRGRKCAHTPPSDSSRARFASKTFIR